MPPPSVCQAIAWGTLAAVRLHRASRTPTPAAVNWRQRSRQRGRTPAASRRLPGQQQWQATPTATRPPSFGIQAEAGVPLIYSSSQDQQAQQPPKSVIPTQKRVTEQLTKHWAPFKDLRQCYAGTRFAEQSQLHMPQKHKATVQVKAGSLAKSKELVVDEAILDVVDLVDVIHDRLTLILHKMLDKGISADGNPKANVAINRKARRREQRTEVIEGGIGSEHAQGGSVRVGRRDTLDEKLGLRLLRAVEIEGEASVFLEYVSASSHRAPQGPQIAWL